MGEAQTHLEVKVKVVPAQPAFPACWADRGKGGQKRETGGDSHRRQTESNRPREKHTVRDSRTRHCSSKGNREHPSEPPAQGAPTDSGDDLPTPGQGRGVSAAADYTAAARGSGPPLQQRGGGGHPSPPLCPGQAPEAWSGSTVLTAERTPA